MPTSKMLNIAVCDNKKDELEETVRMTSQILGETGILHSIARYDSGTALLAVD